MSVETASHPRGLVRLGGEPRPELAVEPGPGGQTETSSTGSTSDARPISSPEAKAPGAGPTRGGALASVGTVAGLTMLSRVLGFVRDIVMARQLGTGAISDAFFVAWTLPNLFRRLFGEGALSAAFVPVFVEAREKGKPEEAARLAQAATTRLALGLTVLVVILEALCAFARHEVALGLAGRPSLVSLLPGKVDLLHADLAIELSQILLPYLVFICVSGLLTGALNSLGHFAAPAAAPCLLNLVWIVALVLGSRWVEGAEVRVHLLSWALLAGGTIQLATHLGAMSRLGIPLEPTLVADPEQLARVRKLFTSVALGLAVFQLNTFVDSVIAWSFAPEGAVSTIFYANRLTQLPIGTVGVAVATAVFPELSRLVARGDRQGFARTTDEAIGASLFIAVPCAVGLSVLAGPIVRVLFERGEFGVEATARTARVVLCFSGAVAAGCVSPVLSRVFHAEQETRLPVRVSLLSVAANLVLNLALVGPLGEAGLALATTISSVGQAVVLYTILIRRRRATGVAAGHGTLAVALARALALGAALAVAARGSHEALTWLAGDAALRASVRAGILAIAIGAGGGAYAGLAWLVRAPELTAMIGLRARRRPVRGRSRSG